MKKGIQISQEDIQKNKDIAAMSYVWVFSIIILIARRDSSFIQLHARQGAILFILSLVLWPLGILRYGEYLILVLSILGFIESAMGHSYRIPIIAQMAEGTLRWHHIKKGVHTVKHTVIRMIKPNHITPEFRQELYKQATELQHTESALGAEEKLLEQEEKKLSSIMHRVEDDEKNIDKLEDEVGELQKQVDSLESSR